MELSCSEYKAIVESSPNMVWRAGTDARCNYFNATWLRFTGRSMEEESGDGWAIGVHPDDMAFCVETYLAAFRKREPFEMEYRLRRHDGQWRWINDRGVPLVDASGDFAGYIGSCMDVTDKVEGRKLTEMAQHDKLTGLYNRNYLEHLLDGEFRKAGQKRNELILLMLDIDHFKAFNDRYGHGFGDKVIHQVARSIAENLRRTDIAGRYGGDEFLVVLPETTTEMAHTIAKRILDAVDALALEDTPAEIGVSIGMAGSADEKDVRPYWKKPTGRCTAQSAPAGTGSAWTEKRRCEASGAHGCR